MELLGPLDAAWLYVDTAETPMQVGALQIFTAPDGAPEDFVGRMLAGFRATPTFGRPWHLRLSGSLLDRVLPAWVVDDRIDLDYHLRHSALPRPGGERELGVLVSRLHSHPLDKTRPLWECHFIEGLQGGRFAVYTKMHHSLIDGISGMRLLQKTLSDDPARRDLPAPWSVSAAGPGEPGAEAASHQPSATGDDSVPLAGVTTLADALRAQLGSIGDAGYALLQLIRGGLRADDPLVAPMSCPWSVLNGRITAQRRFATQRVPLDVLRSLAAAAECTLNDVVLAVCSTALRRYLGEAGALPAEPLTAGVPVNVRPADDAGTGTAISFICANLATDVDDPRQRLAVIKASTTRAKAHLHTLPRQALTQYTISFMAPYILQLLTGLGGRLRPAFNVTISNVPGPDHWLYLNGARMEAMYPLSVLSHGQALNITCLGYAGHVHFGFTGCRDTLPHMQRLAVHAGEAVDELRRALGMTGQPRRSAQRPLRAAPAAAAPGPTAPAKRPASPRRARPRTR